MGGVTLSEPTVVLMQKLYRESCAAEQGQARITAQRREDYEKQHALYVRAQAERERLAQDLTRLGIPLENEKSEFSSNSGTITINSMIITSNSLVSSQKVASALEREMRDS